MLNIKSLQVMPSSESELKTKYIENILEKVLSDSDLNITTLAVEPLERQNLKEVAGKVYQKFYGCSCFSRIKESSHERLRHHPFHLREIRGFS